MSSPHLRWTMFFLASILTAPASAGLAVAAMPGSEFEEEPAEFFCVTPYGGRGEACVSLYLDEDGYEVCLSDEVGKTEHCTSYYGRPDRDEGTFGAPALMSPIGLIDC
ncbi:hypothetical protein GR247_08840 [Rhizobium leguminosarum]|uniref:hypothetical protein n=1 Tax=Rhizobium ruizarguesonis TaxID=2081791 RepID=UPI0012F813A9|nr:hypothetical protein [Rhizobium ruizarguesonis]NEJ20276.1 hypothetical protein [Rhizobium leguminosarum]WSH69743.1 hypothetical protein U8Q05_36845 [Rhizobium ruizarguesonis]